MNQSRLTDLAYLIVRVGAGLTLAYYGAQKMFGLFHGPGPTGTIQFMGTMFGFPSWMAIVAMCGELLGGLGLAFGFLTRIAALGGACVMFTAAYVGVRDHGLAAVLLNGKGQEIAQFFYPLSLGVTCVGLLLTGGGAFSLDKFVFGRKKKAK